MVQNEDGELDVKLPEEYVRAMDNETDWYYEHIWGEFKRYGKRSVVINAESTLSYGFLDIHEKQFMFSCKIRPTDAKEYFGLLLKSNRDASRCLELRFEPGMQRVSLVNLPMDVDPFWRQSCTNVGAPKDPGPDGVRVCEKPFRMKDGDVIDIKVVVDDDMIEIFMGEKAAFTYRVYEETEYEIGLIVQDGNAEYFDLKVTK